MSPAPTPAGYEILGLIAETATVEVYHARELTVGLEVAIKALRLGFATPHAHQRFFRSVRIQAALQHPGIVPVHQVGELPDGRPFLAMKLIKGRTLSSLLDERTSRTADRGQFLAVFEQVCQTIAYAHCRGVIHRDIKPGNVMIGAFGEVQIMSWELATLLDNPEPEWVVGTPLYLPPEQVRGQPADCRSDVFGLGGLLCHILTGTAPFWGETLDEILQIAATGNLTAAFARLDACGADPELVDLCKRCLSPNPSDRPTEGGVVAAAITAYRTAAGDRVRMTEVDRVRVEERRKRRKVQLALVVAVALLLFAIGMWWNVVATK